MTSLVVDMVVVVVAIAMVTEETGKFKFYFPAEI
jgi:hypothetical protein